MPSDHYEADQSQKRADFISALFHVCLVVFLISVILPLSGCASNFLDDREGAADNLAASRGWVSQDIQTVPFTLRSYGPQHDLENRTGMLTVYIEGDGLAWKTRNTPALDPTPDNPVALNLALKDVYGSVAYLARPCQFTIDLDRRLCRPMHWTEARYSEQIVRSMDEGLSILKAAYNAKRIRLIGYSGGGVIAALLAARRNDVTQLVTVAANLDIDYWANLHGVTPLRESLNPIAFASRLKSVVQTHMVGGNDEIVPPSVVQSYVDATGGNAHGSVITFEAMDHKCCWADKWPEIYRTHLIH